MGCLLFFGGVTISLYRFKKLKDVLKAMEVLEVIALEQFVVVSYYTEGKDVDKSKLEESLGHFFVHLLERNTVKFR